MMLFAHLAAYHAALAQGAAPAAPLSPAQAPAQAARASTRAKLSRLRGDAADEPALRSSIFGLSRGASAEGEGEEGGTKPGAVEPARKRSKHSAAAAPPAYLQALQMPPLPFPGIAIKERKLARQRKANAKYRAKPGQKAHKAEVSLRPERPALASAAPPPRPLDATTHPHPTLARPHADPFATAPLGRPRTPPTTLHLCAPQKAKERKVSHPLNDISATPPLTEHRHLSLQSTPEYKKLAAIKASIRRYNNSAAKQKQLAAAQSAYETLAEHGKAAKRAKFVQPSVGQNDSLY